MNATTLAAPATENQVSPAQVETPQARTLAALYVTRTQDLRKPAGSLTLAQAAELCDAVACLRVVCAHVFQYNGHELPDRYRQSVDAIGIGLSVAKARQTLALWDRWTHRIGSPACAVDSADALSAVQGFIWALRDPSYSPKPAALAA